MYELRVYYEDTDTGGVVYYANYLRFFERARTEELRRVGIDVKQLMDEGIFFVVTDVEMKLHSPARYGDILHVATSISKLAGVTMDLEYEVTCEGRRLVTGMTRMACVTPEMKPVRFSKDLKAKLALLSAADGIGASA